MKGFGNLGIFLMSSNICKEYRVSLLCKVRVNFAKIFQFTWISSCFKYCTFIDIVNVGTSARGLARGLVNRFPS